MRPDWNGIYPALTTKLTTDDKLDIPLYLKNIEAQINAGKNRALARLCNSFNDLICRGLLAAGANQRQFI